MARSKRVESADVVKKGSRMLTLKQKYAGFITAATQVIRVFMTLKYCFRWCKLYQLSISVEWRNDIQLHNIYFLWGNFERNVINYNWLGIMR